MYMNNSYLELFNGLYAVKLNDTILTDHSKTEAYLGFVQCNCCGLQIRPVEEQLKQHYCISRKRKLYKRSTMCKQMTDV